MRESTAVPPEVPCCPVMRAGPTCALQPHRSAWVTVARIRFSLILVSCMRRMSAADRCTICLEPVAQQLVFEVSSIQSPVELGGRQLISLVLTSAMKAALSGALRKEFHRLDLPLILVPLASRLLLVGLSVRTCAAGTASSARRLLSERIVACSGWESR